MIEGLDHLLRADRRRAQFSDLDARGVVGDHRCLGRTAARAKNGRQVRRHGVAGPDDVVHLPSHGGNGQAIAVRGDQ